MKTSMGRFVFATASSFFLCIFIVYAQQTIDRKVNDNGTTWVLVEGEPGGRFYISATEVTFEQYDRCCEATKREKPLAPFGAGKQPVINVKVADAVAYCNWLSKETGTIVRLPDQNEWEFAAKGGKKSQRYKYSGSNDVDEVAWYVKNSGQITHEVGTKKPNELGLYDMNGNVWELFGISGLVCGGGTNSFASECVISKRVARRIDRVSKNWMVMEPETIPIVIYGFRPLQEK